MEYVLEWLNPANWIGWLEDNPWLALLIGTPVGALIAWRLARGGLGFRRAVINVVGVGVLLWATLWFADWVQPSLTADDLFTPPVVGPQAVKVALRIVHQMYAVRSLGSRTLKAKPPSSHPR